jgi:TolB protein
LYPGATSVEENVSVARFSQLTCVALAALTIGGCQGEDPVGPRETFPYHLVVERRDGVAGPPDLYVLDITAGEERRLLGPTQGGMHPHGSPDGDRMAFVRMDGQFTSEIFLVDSRDGTDQTNLSNHAQPDVMPAWSRAGGRIAFVSDRMGFQDIFVINTDGTGLRRIGFTDPAPGVTTEWWPAWSPNNQLIAFSSTIDGTADIWTTTVDATPAAYQRLTGTLDSDTHPTWNQDGTRIAFERHDMNTGDADIYVLTLSTLTLQRIQLPGQQLSPAWSPDGSLIAFSSNHEGDPDHEIYTMRPDGTEVTRRTDNGFFDLRPAWLLRPTQP